MRPRVVLMIMVVAVGITALFVVVKGLVTRDGVSDSPEAAGNGVSTSSNANSQVPPNTPSVTTTKRGPVTNGATSVVIVTNRAPVTSVVASTPDEDRKAAVANELEQITLATIDGASDNRAVAYVQDRLLHNEPEVRKAAVIAAVQMNNRAFIPRLQEALARVEDPHEKVKILDAIDYLKLPQSVEEAIAATEADPPFQSIIPSTGTTNK